MHAALCRMAHMTIITLRSTWPRTIICGAVCVRFMGHRPEMFSPRLGIIGEQGVYSASPELDESVIRRKQVYGHYDHHQQALVAEQCYCTHNSCCAGLSVLLSLKTLAFVVV